MQLSQIAMLMKGSRRHGGGVPNTSSTITPSLVASRLGGSSFTGAAPLLVFFDSTAATSSDSSITAGAGAFLNIKHSYVFGDPSSGAWSPTGNSRNSEVGGPLAIHIFEAAGTYTVTDTHSATGTSNINASVTITVSDPNIVYANTLTVVVNGTGTNDGTGPSGCAYVASVSSVSDGHRYLLKRGGTYTFPGGSYSNVRVGAIDATGVIGPTGSGAKPIITGGISIGGGGTGNNVLSDLEIHRTSQIYSDHGLALRCDVISDASTINMLQTQEGDFNVCKYICYAECTTTDTGGTSIAGYYGTTAFFALVGCTTNSEQQHDTRFPNAYKTFVNNNRLKGLGADPSKTSLKMHGDSTTSSSTTWNETSAGRGAYITQFNVISKNIMGSTTSGEPWTCNVDPQNNTSQEAISDVIIEGNQFYRGTSGAPNDLVLGGRRIAYIGNTSINGSMIIATGQNNPAAGFDGGYYSSRV